MLLLDISHNVQLAMKSLILIVLALLVLGGGGYYYMNNMAAPAASDDTEMEQMDESMQAMEEAMNETVDTEAVTATAAAEVMYTEDGYTPKSVTIKAGESVKFSNQIEMETQVGFGEHLSHDEYPDMKTHPTLKMGESDVMTFPKAGTYSYHNHHKEEDKGTVIVQ